MKTVLLLTAAALVSASTLVLADGGHQRGAMIERLKAADTNGDGMLSRAEAAALPRLAERFDAIDANRDNQVTFDELRAARKAHRMRSADANGDGQVTREEFLARAAARFERLDANRDGALTADEMRGHRHHHGRGAKQ